MLHLLPDFELHSLAELGAALVRYMHRAPRTTLSPVLDWSICSIATSLRSSSSAIRSALRASPPHLVKQHLNSLHMSSYDLTNHE